MDGCFCRRRAARERAMLVNLEHIKAIVTAEEVLVLNPSDQAVCQFVNKLQNMLQCHGISASTLTRSPAPRQYFSFDTAFLENPLVQPMISSPSSEALKEKLMGQAGEEVEDSRKISALVSTGAERMNTPTRVDEPDMLPFEFRVLELILETVLHHLDASTQTLEQHTLPVLEELRRGVSTESLEEVRDVKSRMTRLTARVQKVREELEQLLDDDNDMSDLYLTRHRLMSLRVPDSPTVSSAAGKGRVLRQGSLELNMSEPGDSLDVVELEMLLEAYFMQVDGTLNKLNMLRENIDDTEDYVNIELDRRRNQLIQFRLHLSSANCTLTVGLVFISSCGMNLHNWMYDQPPEKTFVVFVSTVSGLCLLLYLVFRLYLRWAHMLSL